MSILNNVLPPFPAVLVADWQEGGLAVDWVHTDSSEGGRLAALHLLELGHRRPCIYCSRFFHGGFIHRIDGFRKTLGNEGIALENLPTPEAPSSLADLRQVLSHPEPPTAIFCTSDPDGIRVLQAVREMGLRVPRDISIVSFDGSPIADLADPPLTTIHADRRRTGERAAELLIGRMEGSVTGPPREIITPVRMQPGGTTTTARAQVAR